ncbi:MAG: hypothetical protein JW945_06465 [Methanomicrobia archaeon]|nr:hypothetical protein [Methanomicrobia archaeon]
MAVLVDKTGRIVATHAITLHGHYDPERWDSDTVSEFIAEKMQLLEDKADIELLQIDGDKIEVVVYVSEPDKPPHTVESYAFFWMMNHDITRENGLFVDTILVTECEVEHSLYIVVGHYKNKNKNKNRSVHE